MAIGCGTQKDKVLVRTLDENNNPTIRKYKLSNLIRENKYE
jgi:hypothetical protein